MDVIVIDSEVWSNLNKRLELMVSILIRMKNQDEKNNILYPEILNWIPLQKLYEILGINKNKWIRHYRHLWKTKKYKRETWIYKPDLEKWLMSKTIN